MLSASHNPMPDNGIKFFARGGEQAGRRARERHRVADAASRGPGPPAPGSAGSATDESRVEDYISHLVNSLGKPVSLEGLKVVVDCANGAAYVAAPAAFEAQGAEVVRIHADARRHQHQRELRLDPHGLAALPRWSPSRPTSASPWTGTPTAAWPWTATGKIVDGDQILAILALALHEAGRLKNDTVVATVMSNLGFVQAMQAAGITVEQTRVGDRYVLEAMKAGGFSLGGEQSGHVVMSEHATTGDGVLTALHVMSRMAATGPSLAELASVMRRLPQVLINVPGVDKGRADSDAALLAAVAAAESELGRVRPGAAAAVGHRVAGPGDGRGRDVRGGQRGRPPAGRRGQVLTGPALDRASGVRARLRSPQQLGQCR